MNSLKHITLAVDNWRKQVAHKMNLSAYTVDEHVQGIYRRFGVSSKSELLSRFIGGGVI